MTALRIRQRVCVLSSVTSLLLASAAPLLAQGAPAGTPATPSNFSIRGFADVAMTTFKAHESFKTILGSSAGPIYGGGGEVVYRDRFSFNVRFSHFSDRGERAFVFNGQRFGLGIPVRITVDPLMAGFNYRFALGKTGFRPYAGIGAGRYSYKETSDFAEPGENVQSSFAAYEVMGGVEVPVIRWLRLAGEVRWVSVPNALGDGGVSKDFGESDLGGLNFGVRILVGR